MLCGIVFYEAFGLNAHNFSSSLNVAHPYRFSRSTPLHRLAPRLLESPDGLRPVEMTIFGAQGNPFHNTRERPTTIRVSLYMFTPRTNGEAGVYILVCIFDFERLLEIGFAWLLTIRLFLHAL